MGVVLDSGCSEDDHLRLAFARAGGWLTARTASAAAPGGVGARDLHRLAERLRELCILAGAAGKLLCGEAVAQRARDRVLQIIRTLQIEVDITLCVLDDLNRVVRISRQLAVDSDKVIALEQLSMRGATRVPGPASILERGYINISAVTNRIPKES